LIIYAFAADIKDADISSPAATVAGNIVRGARYRPSGLKAYLKKKGMGSFTATYQTDNPFGREFSFFDGLSEKASGQSFWNSSLKRIRPLVKIK